MKQNLFSLCALTLAVLFATGCVSPVTRVNAMGDAELRQVEKDDLCFTYVLNLSKNTDAPNVAKEVTRRGETCGYRIETMLDDCSMLRIVNWKPHPKYGNVTVVTVANTSHRVKRFGIGMGNIASSRLEIGPGETQAYGIVVSKEQQLLATVVGAAQGLTPQAPELVDCRTSTGSTPPY